MGGTIDTLKILVEADTAGLQSQLKRAGSNIQSFVGSMNKQEVNWTSILSRTISPALIGGIAATFAMAITEALNFQNAMGNAAATSSTEFQKNLGPASQAALKLQATTGQSASKIASAMGYATQALGSYDAAQQLVADASLYATVSGRDLLDLVKELTPAFANWGIKTAPKVKEAMAQLIEVAAQGKVPLDQLISTLSDSGIALKSVTTFGQTAAAIEALSNQAGMTGDTAVSAFNKFAQAALDPMDNLNLLSGGVGKIKNDIEDEGIAKALGNMATHFQKMDDTTAHILGRKAGFDDTTITAIHDSANHFDTMSKDSADILANTKDLSEYLKQFETPMTKLKIAWGTVKTDIQNIIGTPLLDWLVKVLNGFDDLLHPVETLRDIMQNFKGPALADTFSALGDKLMTISPVMAGVSKIFGGIKGSLDNLFNKNKDTSQTPAGTMNSTVIYNTTNIAPPAVGNGTGTVSAGMQNSAYNAKYGY